MTLDFEDLDDFFDTDEFAASEVLIGPPGSEVPVKAIYDATHLAIDETNAVISTNQPQITCQSSEVAWVQQDMRVVVTINGVTQVFLVDDPQPDGTGITILTLKKA